MVIRLRGKILLPPLILFTLALAISGWYAFTVARDELRRSVMQTLDAHSEALAMALDSAANNAVQDINYLASSPQILTLIQHEYSDTLSQNSEQRRDFSEILRSRITHGVFKSIDIVTVNGKIIASNDPKHLGTDISQDATFKRALSQRETVFGQPYAQPRYETCVPVYTPIMQGDVPLGAIRADIDFSILARRHVNHLRLGETGHAFVAAPGGIIMSHPVRTLIMEPPLPTDSAPIMSARRNGMLQYVWNGTSWLALFRTGEQTGWTTIVKVNLDETFAPIRAVQEKILAMNGIWILVFSLLMIVIAGRISGALLQTIDYARRVSGGALNEELTLRSRDEVGILADSLRTMVKNLREMLTRSVAQQRELERNSQRKTDFLANMSHEIRTPMNAITGFISLFRRDNLDQRQQGYLDKISVASRAMLQIVNDVLDLSKIERGKLQIEQIPFSVRDCTEATGSVIGFSAQAKGLNFTVEIDPHIPPAVIGDPTRVQQVLFNLLGNAVKFTDAGSVSLRVWLEPRPQCAPDSPMSSQQQAQLPQQASLKFEVADTGIGITEEQISLLFNPFSQADASITRKFGGTGLGLAITKKLVELMGGSISVTSNPDKGSVFCFVITVGIAHDQTAILPRTTQDWQHIKFSGHRILVVEDNDINQEIICAMLESFGLDDVVLADNGSAGVDAATTGMFDLILMDMQMPVMDGVTATHKIRDLGRDGTVPYLLDVPIVALTANALSTDVERCAEAGMNAHIAKPVMPEVLHATLQRLLRAPATHSS